MTLWHYKCVWSTHNKCVTASFDDKDEEKIKKYKMKYLIQ